MGINWRELTDEQIAALTFALERRYIKLDPVNEYGYTAAFKNAARELLNGANTEWQRRDLNFRMFGSG